jgi:diapolycopene oxygenase
MTISQSDRVGVVGGGLGGLAAACVLAARGYRVVLLERNGWLGGKAAILQEQGYHFDIGPTILTVPSVLRRIFSEAGQQLEDHLDLIRLDPQWRSFFDDGSVLDLHQDVDKMSAVLEDFSPRTGLSQGYRRFLELSARLDEISQRFFFWRPVSSPRDMFDVRTSFQPFLLRALLDMRPGRSVAATVREHVSDARVAQMLDHFTQYVGSAPDQSPAVLCGIAHMQTNEGVWYPRGGTGAVPQALERLARQLGVEVRSGVGVSRILLDSKGRVRGLQTDDGEQVAVAAVVANSDSVRTHRDLIGGEARQRFERRRRYEPACSGVVLYLGLDHSYEHLAHHNFVFSRDPEEEFDAIYHQGEPAPDPTCYIAAAARTEQAVAPAGGEALYVLVHTPYLRPHHDWKRLFPVYRRVILDKLARTAGLDGLERRIRFESWLTPQDIHERFGVLNGAIYGLASHGKLLGAFKPSNRSPDVPGLYFAGGSAHPGPGMPMVLMSGWIAADALDRDGQVERATARYEASASIASEVQCR